MERWSFLKKTPPGFRMSPLVCILGCCGTLSFLPQLFSMLLQFLSKGQVGHKFKKSSDGGKQAESSSSNWAVFSGEATMIVFFVQ